MDTSEAQQSGVDRFIDLYFAHARVQEIGGPEIAVNELGEALVVLARSDEVQLFLGDIITHHSGSIAVGSEVQVDYVDDGTGPIPEGQLNTDNPYLAMAAEFYDPLIQPDETEGWSSKHFATEKQIKFAHDLGLESVGRTTTKRDASRLITQEVKLRSREIIQSGAIVPHISAFMDPTHGEVEVEDIFPNTGKVTVRPTALGSGGKQQNAFSLDAYSLVRHPRVN